MALSRAALVGATAATVGLGAFAAWTLWPTKERRVERQLTDPTDEQFAAAFQTCRVQQTVEDVQRCVASQLYPGASFPPPPWAASWQKEAWKLIGQRVRGELGLTPPGTKIQAVATASTPDLAAIQAMPAAGATPRHMERPLPLPSRILFGASVAATAAAGGVLIYNRVRS
jgi:hypothetical protein